MSPTSAAMIDAGAPTACHVCHLDQSLNWTLDALETMWDVQGHVRANAHVHVPASDLWLRSRNRNTRIAATAALGRRGAGALRIAQIVDVPVAYNRIWLVLALESALGRRVSPDEYDPTAPPAVQSQQMLRLVSYLADENAHP